MIISQLKGGFGNQLFQYAAALALARNCNVEVKVDVSELRKPDELIGTERNFDLQHLINPPLIAADEEVDVLLNSNPVINLFQKLLPPYKRKIYKETDFTFDPNFFNAGDCLYLKGYRQSEKYFCPIENEIRQNFKIVEDLTKKLTAIAAFQKNNNSISVHIRRGDYSKKNIVEYHGILSEAYYKNAVEFISQKITNPTFYIFTDDIEWTKQNFVIEHPHEFVSGQITKTSMEDFYLMSQCRHNIIANSSFSWWAAWLNPNPNKIVIAPKKWFNNPNLDTSDLIPDGWVKM